MASLLAHFDWTRAAENFNDSEIRQILRMTQDYHQELEFKRQMAWITQTETWFTTGTTGEKFAAEKLELQQQRRLVDRDDQAA